MVQAWIERPLTDAALSAEEQTQVRLVGWLVVLGIPSTLLILTVKVLTGALAEAAVGAVVSSAALGVLLWARRTRSFVVVGHFLGLAAVALNVTSDVLAGEADNLAWLCLGPAAVLFFAGPRAALGWGAVATAGFVGVVLLAVRAHTGGERMALLQTAVSQWTMMPVVLGLAMAFTRSRRAALEALEQARLAAEAVGRTRAAFLATMSHEIRTPLNGVVGTTELLLLRRDTLDQDTVEDLQTIDSSSGMLLRLLNELTDLQRVETGELALVSTDFSVSQATADVVSLFRAGARAKGITLDDDCTLPETLWLRGDAARLRQVLGNLVGNALQQTENLGRVTLRALGSARADGWALTFEVVDTSRGLSPEERAQVFEAVPPGAGAAPTSGLGLPLARRVARAMGGELTVDSEPGRGTTFRLTLTMATGVAPKRTTGAPLRHEDHVGRVLVVDDNAINLKIAGAMIGRLGFEVMTAPDGASALDLMDHRRYDFVLMDRHMPGLDGLEAVRRLRAREVELGLPRTPVFAFTASVLEDEVEACHAAGMDDVLIKPLQLSALEKVLAQHLGRAETPVPAAAAG